MEALCAPELRCPGAGPSLPPAVGAGAGPTAGASPSLRSPGRWVLGSPGKLRGKSRRSTERLLPGQRQRLTALPTSAGARVTPVTHFLLLENKLGVGAAPELLERVFYSLSPRSRAGGGGQGDSKVPAPLRVTRPVCRGHLCPGNAESGASDPSSLLPVGTREPLSHRAHPSQLSQDFGFLGDTSPSAAACSYARSLAVPVFCHQNQAAGQSWHVMTPNTVLRTRTEPAASLSSPGQFVCAPR